MANPRVTPQGQAMGKNATRLAALGAAASGSPKFGCIHWEAAIAKTQE